MLKRITLTLTLLALAVALAACGGNTDVAAPDAGIPDNGLVAIDGFVMGGELREADKETAWIPGYYVLTAGAAYHDGIDYLFQLLGDNQGHYLWVLRVTNNSSQTRHLEYYPHQWRYNFGIRQNGIWRWRLSDSGVPIFGSNELTLHPYQSKEYTAAWNGRDHRGRPIQGLCEAYAAHNGRNAWVLMKGIAWLNGVVH